ncbi:MAG: uroporphyrinogen-III synthase [Planctomycetota bacterium]
MTPARGRIVILRAPDRAEALRAALVEAGFEVVVRPVTCVEYIGPRVGDEWPGWTTAADWVVFTSLNGVNGFARGLGGDTALAKLLTGRRVAVLGATSAQRLAAAGVRIDVVEEHGTATELATALLARMKPDSIVIYPCGEDALPTLPQALRAAGLRVEQLVCYRTAPVPLPERAVLDWSTFDAAIVAAPSAVRALRNEVSLPTDFGFFAIGPTTAAAVREAGFKVLGIADSPKAESIVALVESCRVGEVRQRRM